MRLRPHARAHALRAPRWHRSRRFTSLRDDAGLRSLRRTLEKIYRLLTADLPPIQRCAAGGENGCRWADRALPPSGGGDKRGQGHRMVPLPPLDSPKPSFALTHRRCAAKRGLRGLGSVRRADFGTLLCPEFPLRYPPRITVRGQTVQGGSVPLRKAPLPSSVDPWSTRRHCGPLAFRRATEGSRVLRKGWGVKRGRETLVSLPLLSPPGDPGTSPANRASGSSSAQISRVFFIFSCLQLTFSIFHGILNYRK